MSEAFFYKDKLQQVWQQLSLRNYFNFSHYLKQHMLGDVLAIREKQKCIMVDVNNSKLQKVNYLRVLSVYLPKFLSTYNFFLLMDFSSITTYPVFEIPWHFKIAKPRNFCSDLVTIVMRIKQSVNSFYIKLVMRKEKQNIVLWKDHKQESHITSGTLPKNSAKKKRHLCILIKFSVITNLECASLHTAFEVSFHSFPFFN